MTSKAQRLAEIKEEMLSLIKEAQALVRGTREEERAKGYWGGHIRCALDNDHSYMGGCMVTMQDTIEALEDGND